MDTAFTLEIVAPDQIKSLLERHLDLQRYRVMPDLRDFEIQSLLQSAHDDADNLLGTLGHFSPNVQISVQPHADGAQRVIRIDVTPGPQTRVASVKLGFEGAIVQDSSSQRQTVQNEWALPVGAGFSQDAWDAAKQRALKQLLARRYPAARQLDARAEVQAEHAKVDLRLQLDSGPAYRIGRMEVQGNKRYSSTLVTRLARLNPGDDYAQTELVAAQQRLTDSGYFDSAYLTLDLSSDPEQALIQAQVKEANMQKFVFGIGASTDSGVRISAEHTHNQVPGIGWRAVNKLSVERDTTSFSSDWTSQPDASQWRWALAALMEEQKIGEIDLTTQRYRWGRFTSSDQLDQSYYAQFERADEKQNELQQTTANEAVTANYGFTWRHFDSLPFPSQGWALGGELSVGSTLGEKQQPYSRALLRWLAYQPLGTTAASRMMFRAQLGGVVVDDANTVPFSQLFLTGGDTTVRGYKLNEIGITQKGVLTADAGRYLATAGVEWQRPVFRNGLMTDWESVVFLDSGAIANRVEAFDFKVGIGVGARWKSPIGPLQVDLAYGVATQALRMHLNVGFAF